MTAWNLDVLNPYKVRYQRKRKRCDMWWHTQRELMYLSQQSRGEGAMTHKRPHGNATSNKARNAPVALRPIRLSGAASLQQQLWIIGALYYPACLPVLCNSFVLNYYCRSSSRGPELYQETTKNTTTTKNSSLTVLLTCGNQTRADIDGWRFLSTFLLTTLASGGVANSCSHKQCFDQNGHPLLSQPVGASLVFHGTFFRFQNQPR